MRSRIDPVKKFVRTVRAHLELLLNYSRAKKQFSSGVIEGPSSPCITCSAAFQSQKSPENFF